VRRGVRRGEERGASEESEEREEREERSEEN
jgi:hypothetical protein